MYILHIETIYIFLLTRLGKRGNNSRFIGLSGQVHDGTLVVLTLHFIGVYESH